MILTIDNQESATLTLHMGIMRKSFRNLIKAKYKDHKNDLLASFDYVHEQAKKGLEATGNLGFDFYTMNLNIRDLEMINEFLRAYTNKVDSEFKDQLQEVDKEQLKILNKLHQKCNAMILEIR